MATHGLKRANAVEIVPESPVAKRQRTESEQPSRESYGGYNSNADSGDELFSDIRSTPPSHSTQPTQLVNRNTLLESSPAVESSDPIQIPASSPYRPPPTDSNRVGPGRAPAIGRLASLKQPKGPLQPRGTDFRAPARAPPVTNTIDLISDEDVSNKNGRHNRADIPSSSFASRGNKEFSSIIAKSAYHPGPSKSHQSKPSQSTGLKFAPGMSMQSKPERARPVQDSMILDQMTDLRMKELVLKVQAIYPHRSIGDCKSALEQAKGNKERALSILADRDPVPIESSDDELSRKPDPAPQMERKLEKPIQSIQHRYGNQKFKVFDTPDKSEPKRRLVKGRRNPSPSPVASSPPEPLAVESDNESADSAVGSDPDDDLDTNGKFLKWLNTCSVEDLTDLSSLDKASTKDACDAMLKARPFKNLAAAERFTIARLTKTGKKRAGPTTGERIVEAALKMWKGYAAVDSLCAQCDHIAKPLADEMSKWGVDVFGASTDGELQMTTLDSPGDSGVDVASSAVDDDEIKSKGGRQIKKSFLKQPVMMSSEVTLKDYQLVGLNWLALLYKHKLSGILADDMGLGKTCQVIAFLSHLCETGYKGPHLVIVPGSTLENWLREFEKFSPKLTVLPHHGSQADRAQNADTILARRNEVNVVVTTYDMAYKPHDNRFLRHLKPDACVYDEGHLLKNPESQRYGALVKIPSKFKLLLTGTPLQNNLQELTALLGFILPNVFNDRREDLNHIFKHKATTMDKDHAALLSEQRVTRARSMLTPFVLRRKKQHVLKDIPAKHCRVEYCDLHPTQYAIYRGHLDDAKERARLRLEGVKAPKTDEENPMMQLRKAAIHPLLFRRHFDDDKVEVMADLLRENHPSDFDPKQARKHLVGEMHAHNDFVLHTWCSIYPAIEDFDVEEEAWMKSGKVEALVRLLKQYRENGDRVLIFSQFSKVIDILQAVMNTIRIAFTRIDGGTPIDQRQSLIDQFKEDNGITAFLLTTKAGGTGLNLMYANKVIIFDGSFNPQDDVQAENRAHRMGQTREVEVVRLVTRGTIEEQIYALGQSKLALDAKVNGDDHGEDLVAKMLLEAPPMEAINTEDTVMGGVEKSDGDVKNGTVQKEDVTAKEVTVKEDAEATKEKELALEAMVEKNRPRRPKKVKKEKEVVEEGPRRPRRAAAAAKTKLQGSGYASEDLE